MFGGDVRIVAKYFEFTPSSPFRSFPMMKEGKCYCFGPNTRDAGKFSNVREGKSIQRVEKRTTKMLDPCG
jgi:hypothetical protein